MIQQITKWAVEAATPTTPQSSKPTYDQNSFSTLTRVRIIAAVILVFVAYVFTTHEMFLAAYPLAFIALLLTTAEDIDRYYRYLRRLRHAQDMALHGISPRGEFTGDGVPRDQGDQPFEPLSWEGVQV